MQVRRKSKITPYAIVRSSLIVTPVAPVAPIKGDSFADVLVEAIAAPRALESSQAQPTGGASAASDSSESTQQKEVTPPPAWSPYCKTPVDLYEQLDTMMREKSMLIAIV